jgi:hypothetical protein
MAGSDAADKMAELIAVQKNSKIAARSNFLARISSIESRVRKSHFVGRVARQSGAREIEPNRAIISHMQVGNWWGISCIPSHIPPLSSFYLYYFVL